MLAGLNPFRILVTFNPVLTEPNVLEGILIPFWPRRVVKVPKAFSIPFRFKSLCCRY